MLKIDPRLNLINDDRPIVAVDIDGVLNYLGWRLTSTELNRTRIGGYLINVRKDILDVLAPLVEAQRRGQLLLAWGTMWEDEAPTKFAPRCLSGLGEEWPVIYFTKGLSLAERKTLQDEQAQEHMWDVCFKTPALAEFSRATGRRVVWLDDMIGDADRAYLRARSEIDESPRVIGISIDPAEGLTREITERVVAQLASMLV